MLPQINRSPESEVTCKSSLGCRRLKSTGDRQRNVEMVSEQNLDKEIRRPSRMRRLPLHPDNAQVAGAAAHLPPLTSSDALGSVAADRRRHKELPALTGVPGAVQSDVSNLEGRRKASGKPRKSQVASADKKTSDGRKPIDVSATDPRRRRFESAPNAIQGDVSLMRPKTHGTCLNPPMCPLRWQCDWEKADEVCCFNQHGAETSGYFLKTSFLREAKQAQEITFYDSVTGQPLFIVPRGRSVRDFVKESRKHGWPSFRDGEVVTENVRVLPDGETVSVHGTHLGHNLPDRHGNRYCINLISVAGVPLQDMQTSAPAMPAAISSPVASALVSPLAKAALCHEQAPHSGVQSGTVKSAQRLHSSDGDAFSALRLSAQLLT